MKMKTKRRMNFKLTPLVLVDLFHYKTRLYGNFHIEFMLSLSNIYKDRATELHISHFYNGERM